MWNELTELSGLVHDFGGKVGCVGKLSQGDRPPRRYLLSACGYHKPNASIKQAFTYWWRRPESARKTGARAKSLARSASAKPCLTKPCPRPAWTRVNATWYHQIKNHRKGGFLFGGGGGNRLVSRGSRYIARPLGQRQAMLDETLPSPRVDAR